jgi:hypothetical protein
MPKLPLIDLLRIKARTKGVIDVSDSNCLTFEGAREYGQDFSGRTLDRFSAVASSFESCKFERMRVSDLCFGAGRNDSVYIDCSFDGARLSNISGGNARFERCSFRNVLLESFFCHDVEFVECTFSGKMVKGYFNGTVSADIRRTLGRKANEFRNNDFSQMELVDVSFRTGIDLARQKLPGGPDYLLIRGAEEALAKARTEVMRWTASEVQRDALTMLDSLAFDCQGGQKDLFVPTADAMPAFWPEAREGVFRILTQLSGAFGAD